MTNEEIEFRKGLYQYVEYTIVTNFYRTGVWTSCGTTKRYIFVAYLKGGDNNDDYVVKSYIDRNFEDIYNDVLNDLFEIKHIASHKYCITRNGEVITFYTQTSGQMAKILRKEYGEEADHILENSERKVYSADFSKFRQNMGETFPEASQEEKNFISKIYPLLAVRAKYVIKPDEYEECRDFEKGMLYRNIEKSEEKKFRAIIDKYFNKLYDEAIKESKNSLMSFTKSHDFMPDKAKETEGLQEFFNDIEDFEDDESLELDANAFLDEWEDAHDTAPTYEDVLDYCFEPKVVDAIYNFIKTGSTSYKNEEEYAKLLWKAIQELLL